MTPKDLEVVEVHTTDLIGHEVTNIDTQNHLFKGKVIKAEKEPLLLDMQKTEGGIITNVQITILDDSGIEHEGTLYIGE